MRIIEHYEIRINEIGVRVEQCTICRNRDTICRIEIGSILRIKIFLATYKRSSIYAILHL